MPSRSNGSAGAIGELAHTYPHPLRVATEPRPGPASARNTGAAASGGDILLFLGDDMAPDGRFFIIRPQEETGGAAVSNMIVVQNWFEELKRLVPTK